MRPRFRRISAGVQARLDELMAKNNEGTLDAAERHEFEELGRTVEEISLANARLLAGRVAMVATPPEKPALSVKQRRTEEKLRARRLKYRDHLLRRLSAKPAAGS